MAVKSKVKPKSKVKSKSVVRAKKLTSKPSVKVQASKKPASRQGERSKTAVRLSARPEVKIEPVVESASAAKTLPKRAPKVAVVVKRIVNPLLERRRPIKRSLRVNQFAFMKAPGHEHAFEVGDTVEVFCDHEKSRERIRGWVKGIVVQVDNKLVAVQFRSNVYLTDGWMVPDRILWFPLISEHIRPVPGKKPAKKDFIPDY
ncbi:MAG: hypothetical protein HY864_12560 [Chloroflexi bacterium]|nr:hypothetical protein [Chloroflexota bacterium]